MISTLLYTSKYRGQSCWRVNRIRTQAREGAGVRLAVVIVEPFTAETVTLLKRNKKVPQKCVVHWTKLFCVMNLWTLVFIGARPESVRQFDDTIYYCKKPLSWFTCRCKTCWKESRTRRGARGAGLWPFKTSTRPRSTCGIASSTSTTTTKWYQPFVNFTC